MVDEAGDCGKGANAVVSMLHYFLDNHGLGETEVYFHADNCTGQNKNSTMVQYLLWRCLTGKHQKITLSFLVVGHTKFAPDWCFGLFKRLFRRSKVGSLNGIARVVNESAQCNFSQLVATEDGTSIVPVYNWTDFFATKLKKLIGIKKFHHFHFDSISPGIVSVKEQCDTLESKINLLKAPWSPDSELPAVIHPKPMSVERQWYLYNQIRPFCPESDKDITCPLPSVPMVSSRSCSPALPAPNNELEDDNSSGRDNASSKLPPQKRRRLCGICKKEGHNSRSCSQREQ